MIDSVFLVLKEVSELPYNTAELYIKLKANDAYCSRV
jgi:hypothetical protein